MIFEEVLGQVSYSAELTCWRVRTRLDAEIQMEAYVTGIDQELHVLCAMSDCAPTMH